MSSQGRGSLFGRLAFGIIAGFLLLHALTLVYFGHERMVAQAGVFAATTAERALTIADAAQSQPDILALLSTPSFELSIEREVRETPRRVWPHTNEVGAALQAKLRELSFEGVDEVRFWYVDERRETWLLLQLPMAEGWLTVRAAGLDVRGHTVVATFWMTSLAALILLIVLAATRRYTRVLPELADAAEQIGRAAEPRTLEPRGPRELSRLIAAFNTMQARVDRLLKERNTMLGALSHDVRTVVTRLGLRMESMPATETRAACERDIAEITAMLEDSLDYARNEASGEQVEAVDLHSLLTTLADDWTDQGTDVTFSGTGSMIVQAEPAGLRRALQNLIENAVRYGGAARLSLSQGNGAAVRVDVVDPGEGIESGLEERAMAPFERLEGSRNRHTGGVGLGLAIARRIIERHRGRLEFQRETDGFRVSVILPA